MNFLIINHNASNLGDVAIAEATITHLNDNFKDCKITLESSDPEISKQYFKNIKIIPRLFDVRKVNHTERIFSVDFIVKNIPFLAKTIKFIFSSIGLIIFPRTNKKLPFLQELRQADIVLSIAGDSIQAKYAYYLRFFEIWLIKKLNKPLVLYAQSIGPFFGYQKILAKKYLSFATLILARDQRTADLLRECGVSSKIELTADSVISLMPSQSEIAQKTKQQFLLGNYIGMVIRTRMYSGMNQKEHELYLGGMNKLINFLKAKNYKIIFLASIGEDLITTESFLKQYNLDESILDLRQFLPSEAKTILSPLKYIFSTRMHPIILATSMNVPGIGISNEFKMREYLKIVNLEEYCVDFYDFNYTKAAKVFCEIEDQYDAIKKQLIESYDNANLLSNQNIQHLKELVLTSK